MMITKLAASQSKKNMHPSLLNWFRSFLPTQGYVDRYERMRGSAGALFGLVLTGSITYLVLGDTIGTAWGAAISSFCFFASGALIPVLPYLFGAVGLTAVVIASVLVGLALLLTGTIVGLLSGASPLKRALRQLAIGFGAAAATYLLGIAFGATLG